MEPNVFRESIVRGKITSEADLKRLFRSLALRLHPDTALNQNTSEQFLRLKRDYDEALRERGWTLSSKRTPERFSFDLCVELFGELIASNFPAERSIRTSNKLYARRADRLNALIGSLGEKYIDLFAAVEREMLALRGDSVVNNHNFNVVKIYFCNLYDCFFSRCLFSKIYIKNSYALIMEVLRENNCNATERFLNFMLSSGGLGG